MVAQAEQASGVRRPASSESQPIRLAINGYGRIGRCVLRALYETDFRHFLQVVAINEPADCATIAHLTKYDSTHGRFPADVSATGDVLTINGDAIAVSHFENISDIDWVAQNVDVVLECSGLYSREAELQQHLQQGAKKVLLSQPGENTLKAIVCGINVDQLSAADRIVSAASCTSNCIVPVIDTLHRQFNIQSGVITTIHSAMNDQPVIDAYHHTDLRKTRAAGQSIIPVETGLAAGIARVLPALDGKFSARALRVPTTNVSIMELSIQIEKTADAQSVNNALREAAANDLMGVLGVTDEPLASCDFNHDPRSGIVDLGQTRVSGEMVNVLVWFDNEWGYANRMLDIVASWFDAGVRP
jgi:glyceraldehyde-3-phosphate dehydrogenase type I